MNKLFWKLSLAVFDYRTKLRWIRKEPLIDVAFITNFRDAADRKRFIGNQSLKQGFEPGPRIILNNTMGRAIGIDLLSENLFSSEGRRAGRRYFIAATEWAQNKGAKVILLAAATKRLFGKEGKQLKELFPGLMFTIGDNGTAYLLIQEIKRAFKLTNLNISNSRIAVLGASGVLGQQVISYLVKQNTQIIAITSAASLIDKGQQFKKIDLRHELNGLQSIDAVIACTHKNKFRLGANIVESIRPAGKKLLLIDVAEPANLSVEEYQKCKDVVIRFDAGNGHSPKFKYILGPLFTRMLHIPSGTTFGCFAEAISLASAIKRGVNVTNRDWFKVNDQNMEFVSDLFRHEKFELPMPNCFSSPVNSFDLNLTD